MISASKYLESQHIKLLYYVLVSWIPSALTIGQFAPDVQAAENSMKDYMSINTILEVGVEAPEFNLPNQSGAMVSLSEFRGKFVVVYFYPEDNTPGCTKESCDFRDNYVPFQKSGTVVLGISPDSEESHVKFIADHNLPFTLLSDTEKKTLNAYGVWGPKTFAGKSYEGVVRSTVLIDPEGKIVKIWSPITVAGHVDEVLNEVEQGVKARK